ncbi:MAG: response regulator, partial [Candidatus Cloacimonadaceae bacterium]|nr:response regulator [Candidatus Cloacimonadaceae bacterium]
MEKFLRILFIEDSEDDVFLIVSHIQNAGYTVSSTRVDNGPDFVKALEQEDYWDAILSDYALPGFSGRRALDIFRKTGLKIPFILVSGALGEDIAVLMLKSGA